MLVVEDKRLVEFDELFGASKIAFLLSQRSLLHMQGDGGTVDAGDHRLLHGNGESLVALLGDGNRFEFQLEPVLEAGLAAVILAMRQAGELNAAAHVHWIEGGGCQLIHPRVLSRDYSGGDQGHATASHIHRNYIETLSLVRRELAKICSRKG